MNLSKWQNFYVIVGSAGAALVGVQFVVITLIANMRRRADLAAIHAFGTPTVVHFGMAMMLSSILTAPWPTPHAVAIAVVASGVGGFAYSTRVFARARRQSQYKPVAEDWLWYAIVPCAIYAVLAVAGFFIWRSSGLALFIIAGAALGLLLVGIRNAWDTVTHVAIENTRDEEPSSTKRPS